MRRTRLHRTVAATLLAYLAGLPAIASAASLDIYWRRFYDAVGDVNDLETTGGGSSTTALSLTSGLDVGSIPYNLSLGSDPNTGTVFGATCDSTSGGTVSYGHISGGVSAYSASNVSGCSTFVDFRASFLDSVTITPSDPSLLGKLGIMSGSVLVDVSPNLTTIGTTGVPNVEASVQVSWLLKLNDSNQANGYYLDTDEDAPYSFFSGPPSASPAPNSVLIPILVGFTFGTPFDFGLGFDAEATASGGNTGTNSYAIADAQMSFLNTVAWQGISSVTRNGAPVDFTLSSDSGADYTQAATAVVPAPAGIWLLGTALAGLTARRWRRRG